MPMRPEGSKRERFNRAQQPTDRNASLTRKRPRPGENDWVSTGLGLRLNLPDNGAVARSLLGVLVLAAIALFWGPAGAATATAAAGAIAGAIALQDSPLGRIPIVVAVSVELGAAVLAGGLTAAYSAVFVVVVALWCFFAGMQWAVGAPAGLIAGAASVLLVIQHPQSALAAVMSALLAVVAGLTQAALIAVWPPRRWRLEREALTKVYRSLSADARQAGRRSRSAGRLHAAVGAEGSVQQQRDSVRPAHARIPGLARVAGTDRRDVDGDSWQARGARLHQRRIDRHRRRARDDRRTEPDFATRRGTRA